MVGEKDQKLLLLFVKISDALQWHREVSACFGKSKFPHIDLTPQVGHFKTEVPLFVSLFGLFAAMVR